MPQTETEQTVACPHVRGLWWTFCRACKRHSRAEAVDA